MSGIIFVNRNGLRWWDAPAAYGPHKTLYSRWKRLSEKGIFARMMAGLAAEHSEEKTVMIPSHRSFVSTAGQWTRPIDLFVTAGQVSDYIGARALLSGLPNVKWLLGDRGYDADWLIESLQNKWLRLCIPGRRQRKTPVKYDKRRNRIEIMFGRLGSVDVQDSQLI